MSTDFQKRIGYVDVKSSPVYFYVQRKADGFNTKKTPIPFDKEKLNVGGAMNSTSGKFTAPRDGIYSFSFTGDANLPGSTSRAYLYVNMYLNGNWIGSGMADEVTTADQYETFSFQSTRLLNGRAATGNVAHRSPQSTGIARRSNTVGVIDRLLIENGRECDIEDLPPSAQYP